MGSKQEEAGATVPKLLPACCLSSSHLAVVYCLVFLACAGVTGCVSTAGVGRPEVRYLAFGDSTTAGTGQRDYPDILCEKLGVEPSACANEGRGGETTGEGLQRLSELIAQRTYPNVDVLLYWEGGNDITSFIEAHDRFLLSSPLSIEYRWAEELALELDAIEANVAAAVALGHKEGWSVCVATCYPLREAPGPCATLPLKFILPFQARNANDYVRLLNERIRQAARRSGAVLVDVAELGDMLTAGPDNYCNCNHLSPQGNELVAELFAAALSE